MTDPDVRVLGFRDAFRLARERRPGSWNSVATGLAAMVSLWLVHLWLLTTQDVPSSAVGVVLLPLGLAVTLRGWVHPGALVMAIGLAIGFVGAAAPFWLL